MGHRVQCGAPLDCIIAASLSAGVVSHDCTEDGGHYPANVIPLNAIRHARLNWRDATVGAHLNDYLIDGGRRRRQCLPYAGSNAWSIRTEALGSFLAFLCDRKVSFLRIVARTGLLQAAPGPVDTLAERGGVSVALSDGGLFAIDLKDVESA